MTWADWSLRQLGEEAGGKQQSAKTALKGEPTLSGSRLEYLRGIVWRAAD